MMDMDTHQPINRRRGRTEGEARRRNACSASARGLPPGTPGNAARVLLSGAKTEATPPWGACWWCLAVEKDAVPAQLDFRNVA